MYMSGKCGGYKDMFLQCEEGVKYFIGLNLVFDYNFGWCLTTMRLVCLQRDPRDVHSSTNGTGGKATQ